MMPNDTRPGRRAGHRDARRAAASRRRRPRRRGLRQGRGHAMRALRPRLGLKIAAHEADPREGRGASARRRDCVAYTGITANGAVRMFPPRRARRKLFASDGVAESGFTRRLRGLGRQAHTITVSTLAPDAYGPAGAAIIGSADPYKLYGYEAMKLILDGLNAAGASRRRCSATCRRASRTARACSAPTRSTPTATRRSAPTASTGSAGSHSCGRASHHGRLARRAARCRRA